MSTHAAIKVSATAGICAEIRGVCKKNNIFIICNQ